MRHLLLFIGLLLAWNAQPTFVAAEPLKPTHRDLVYGEASGQKLLLNLYLPTNVEHAPLVVYIHGGSWRAGSYQTCSVDYLANEGFAVASIEYRFSNVTIFPAQIHDCKAAIRWLRAHAKEYGYDATKIGVAGSSAGGHLAVLLGTSGDVVDLEGDIGGNADQSSRVAAVVDYYGPTDFVLRGKTHHARANAPDSSTYQLLGGAANANPDKARRASGVTYVTADDPPMLILHGDRDKTVYMDQSESLRDAYTQAKLPVELIVVPGGGHGGAVYHTGENRRRVIKFFRQHLTNAKP
ncbi:MAG: alpha/beta hydrolase [Planctomycetaceae bacterium]|nr:alpha/beta hydrolase [Planctomycetaceae bacterium]